MSLAAFAIAALCLVSVSHSAPLACEDLVRPLDQVDLHHLAGRWVLVAGSLNDTAAADVLKRRDSVAVYLYNSSYTQANNFGDWCRYHPRNISLDGHIFTIQVKAFNFTGTFFHTSCQDCLVLTLAKKSPQYESVDFYLLSKRRELEEEEMEEFRAQVECLQMPPPTVMDPTKELCPERTEDKAEE